VFMRDGVVRGLELPRSTRSRMQQPRKPNASDGAISSKSPLLFANRISDDSSPVEYIPLPRCSTGPEPGSLPDLLAANGWHDPATRRTVSANKLTRMGFFRQGRATHLLCHVFWCTNKNLDSASSCFSKPSDIAIIRYSFILIFLPQSFSRSLSCCAHVQYVCYPLLSCCVMLP